MIRALLIAVVLAGCGGSAATDEGSGVADYVDEYGGSRTAYARILAMTDCAQLQEEFDTAAANNDAAEPGTDPHRQSLGFMTASEDRHQALDC